MVTLNDPKRPRKVTKEIVRRTCTRNYFLDNSDGNTVAVCQTFFLGTLGYTNDCNISTVFKKLSTQSLIPSPDQRGRKFPATKKEATLFKKVTDHILSFNPSISHYRRKHAPKRLYISPEFNIQGMYDDFVSTNTAQVSVVL